MIQQTAPEEAPMIMAALTQETVEIRENFSGAELILYGATRGLTIEDEIVVVLRGPDSDLRVMQRERNFGIWVNRAPRNFEAVPSYYSIASTQPLENIATLEALQRNAIGLRQILSEPNQTESAETRAYREAIERAGNRDALYSTAPRGVEVLDGGLFRATLVLPPKIPVGTYDAEVYLFRDGRPIASRTTSLRVVKAGFERWIYDMAHDWPLLYGLLCVILAALAGYAAAAAFSRR
ncbi:MAG: hypothetical protein GYB36_00175 [Alphaproteobacteria bacterium]|nr:hypothetical protein [Alphaproteobacteria bacterium]